MSSDIGNAMGNGLALYPDNKFHCDEAFFGNDELYFPDPYSSFSRARNDIADSLGSWSFRTPWWPKHGGFIGSQDVDVGIIDRAPGRIDNIWLLSGANGRLSFVGITRDAYGSPLGGCTIRCFRTSTNELVSQVTSDANGNYIATTPYFDAHFITVHLAGSPPIAGATIDTLTPS